MAKVDPHPRVTIPHRGQWLSAARGCDYATFFHTPMWAELFSWYTGGLWRPHAEMFAFEDGVTALLTGSVQTRLGGVMRLRAYAVAGGYGGWISERKLSDRHVRALYARILGDGPVIWRENPFDPACEALRLPGKDESYTHVIDLAGLADPLEAGSRAHRKAAAKAQRGGITVRRTRDLNDYRAYYEVYRKSVRRWHGKGLTRSEVYQWPLFERIADCISEHARLWLAELDGRIASGVLCFYWNEHAVAWHGASDELFYALRPSNLLYLTMARDALERGYRWFDLNPSGNYGGVEKFKEHIGARKMRSRNIVRLSPLWRLAGALYRSLRQKSRRT